LEAALHGHLNEVLKAEIRDAERAVTNVSVKPRTASRPSCAARSPVPDLARG